MYSELLTKLKTTLGTITRIKQLSMYPTTNLTAFPAVIVVPAGVENSFDTVSDNMKIYRFELNVAVGINDAVTEQVAFEKTLPNVIDDIIAKFDSTWDNGTSSEGRRIWQKIDTADSWQIIDDSDGRMAYALLNLEIKVQTSA